MNARDSLHERHIPSTISTEAQDFLRSLEDEDAMPALPGIDDLATWKELFDQIELANSQSSDEVVAHYLPVIESREIHGIPVLDIRPQTWVENAKIIVYLHGVAIPSLVPDQPWPAVFQLPPIVACGLSQSITLLLPWLNGSR